MHEIDFTTIKYNSQQYNRIALRYYELDFQNSLIDPFDMLSDEDSYLSATKSTEWKINVEGNFHYAYQFTIDFNKKVIKRVRYNFW